MFWVLVLYFAGMVLILAEFILPGAVAGLLGFGLVVGSAVLAGMNYPEAIWLIIAAELIGAIVIIGLGMWILSRTGMLHALVLTKAEHPHEGYVNEPSDASLIGKRGRAVTPLRPAGVVVIEGRRIDSVSNGAYIEQGAEVQVIAVQGNRIVVDVLPNDAQTG
jgi:membrane-bound serine protease (ClpP class)